MKKYLSLIAVLALLVSCMIIPASAAGTFEAIIESKEVALGEGTVVVELAVTTGEVGYAGGEFNGLAVTEGATIKEVKMGAVAGAYNPDNGTVGFFTSNDVNGTLFTIVVEVPVSKPATFTVSFTKAVASGAATEEQEVAVTAGVITVTHDCVAGEWEVVKEATCEEAGKKIQKCTLCDKILAEEEIPALGHAWDKGVLPEAYDCDEVLKTFTCERCGATKTEDASHDHAMVKVALSDRTDEEGNYYVTYQDVCSHSKDHGCTEAGEPYEVLVKAPITGDITPYIAMGALTMVALVSAAAYMLLKRKAI